MMIVEQMLNNAPNPLLHIADVSGSALFQGDCLDIMPLIPDKSVQLILADLPYGTTACKWDSIIDLDLLWKQYKRIIKDNGAIVLTASQPFTTKLISSNYEMYRYNWVWHKTRPSNFPLAKKQPMKYHEDICVFGIKSPDYYPQMIKSDKIRKKGKNDGYRGFNKGLEKPEYLDKEYTDFYPSSIQTFPFHNGGLLHPTQKPLELMKYLISTYSNENDMVLDNTMGSGTTCLAAKELNRKFIGIEKEANYYEIACRRCGF
jgi:site-specific DNA-methyltransferase (adenine-specific)